MATGAETPGVNGPSTTVTIIDEYVVHQTIPKYNYMVSYAFNDDPEYLPSFRYYVEKNLIYIWKKAYTSGVTKVLYEFGKLPPPDYVVYQDPTMDLWDQVKQVVRGKRSRSIYPEDM